MTISNIKNALNKFVDKNECLLIFVTILSTIFYGVTKNGNEISKSFFNVLILVSFMFMIFLYLLNRKKAGSLLIIAALYELWIVVTTLINNREVGFVASISNMIIVLNIGLIIGYFSNDIKILLKGTLPVFEILIYINFISLFVYDASVNGNNYFLGYYNTMMLYTYSAILISAIYLYENKLSIRPIILIVVSVLTTILAKGATPIGALLASIIAFGFGMFLLKKKSQFIKHYLFALSIFVVLFNAYILFIYDPQNTIILKFIIEKVLKRNLTFTGRIDIWKAAIDMFKNKIICGYGYGTSVVTSFGFKALHAHNEFLQVLVRCGVIGFALFVAFTSTIIKEVDSSENNILKVVIISLLFGIFLSYTTDAYLRQGFYFVYFLAYYYCINRKSNKQ